MDGCQGKLDYFGTIVVGFELQEGDAVMRFTQIANHDNFDWPEKFFDFLMRTNLNVYFYISKLFNKFRIWAWVICRMPYPLRAHNASAGLPPRAPAKPVAGSSQKELGLPNCQLGAIFLG